MPSPDRTTGDRVVRGGATSRTVVRELSARGLQHGIDPAATEGPEAVGDAGGLRRLIPQAVGNSEIFNARCAENRIQKIRAQLIGQQELLNIGQIATLRNRYISPLKYWASILSRRLVE